MKKNLILFFVGVFIHILICIIDVNYSLQIKTLTGSLIIQSISLVTSIIIATGFYIFHKDKNVFFQVLFKVHLTLSVLLYIFRIISLFGVFDNNTITPRSKSPVDVLRQDSSHIDMNLVLDNQKRDSMLTVASKEYNWDKDKLFEYYTIGALAWEPFKDTVKSIWKTYENMDIPVNTVASYPTEIIYKGKEFQYKVYYYYRGLDNQEYKVLLYCDKKKCYVISHLPSIL